MDEIEIPYHLAIPAIICLVGLLTLLLNRKKLFSKNRVLWKSVTVFLIIYLFFVGTATYDAIYYAWDLHRYDLDKDGMFTGAEITDESEEAMSRLINDTGRNFTFITGFIFASIISIFVYIRESIKLK
jgi:hypothetical protein